MSRNSQGTERKRESFRRSKEYVERWEVRKSIAHLGITRAREFLGEKQRMEPKTWTTQLLHVRDALLEMLVGYKESLNSCSFCHLIKEWPI